MTTKGNERSTLSQFIEQRIAERQQAKLDGNGVAVKLQHIRNDNADMGAYVSSSSMGHDTLSDSREIVNKLQQMKHVNTAMLASMSEISIIKEDKDLTGGDIRRFRTGFEAVNRMLERMGFYPKK